jgi:hypothetical protein
VEGFILFKKKYFPWAINIFYGKKGVVVALPSHGYQNCTYPKFVIKIEGIFFSPKIFFYILYGIWNME